MDNGLARVRFVEPQPLGARDLTAALASELRHQALHVRGLHDTWGVATGLDVQETFGDLFLAPGLAYDVYGRSLVMASQGGILPLPPTPTQGDPPWWFDLVVRYHEPAPGLGRTRPGRPGLDSASWRWCYAGPNQGEAPPPLAAEVRLGLDIPLARVQIAAEGRLASLDLSLRRVAARQVRPHLAGGRIQRQVAVVDNNPLGCSVTVNTADGGFSQTPFYLAALVENPFMPAARQGRLRWRLLASIAGPFLNITEPARDHFTLEIRYGALGDIQGLVGEAVQVLPLVIDWLGVEPLAGCA